MKRYLLVDGNNITHAAQGMKKLTVGDTQVQAIFGFLKQMRKLLHQYPLLTPVVLWDGASWRNMQFPEYKNNREKSHTAAYQRTLEERQSAKKQMPAIKKALTLLGIDQVKASNMEADDLAAIIADLKVRQGGRVMLVSGDRDWIQLVGPGISWFDPINDRKVMKAADLEQAIGIRVDRIEQYVEVKALMGDIGDNIPGVGGIGEKGAQEFIDKFDCWANFSNMALDGSLDLSVVNPRFRKAFERLAEDEDKRIRFAGNLALMDLRHTARPKPVNMHVTKGDPDRDRFQVFCERLVFQSFLKDLDAWLSVFPAFRQSLEEAA